jgi:putative hemolysin
MVTNRIPKQGSAVPSGVPLIGRLQSATVIKAGTESPAGGEQSPSANDPPLEGRFCGQCGGDLRPVRQRKGTHLTTYLVCQMPLCTYSLPLLDFDEKTGEHTSLLPTDSRG